MASNRPIFILGCPRSGTTLLQLMLHSHPRIAIPQELRFLLSFYKRRNHLGDLTDPEWRRQLGERITGSPKTRFHELGLDADEVVEEIVAGPPTLGSAIDIIMRAYAQRLGKPRWGDKRPSYHHYIPGVLRLFPEAQIVHIVRDGRDCVASLKEMPWFKGDVYRAMYMWTEAIEHGRAAARKLPASTYYELQYERLSADPERQLGALCDFLGEDYHPAMAEPYKIAGESVPARKKHHDRTRGEITTVRSGSYADRLEPWEIALCEKVMGSRLLSYGYELSGEGKVSARHLAHYARTVSHRRYEASERRARERWRRLRERGPVATQLPVEAAAVTD